MHCLHLKENSALFIGPFFKTFYFICRCLKAKLLKRSVYNTMNVCKKKKKVATDLKILTLLSSSPSVILELY